MNDVMNDAIDQIIINLKTIGKLKINDKLYMSNGYITIQNESITRPLVRKVYGYSREQSCIVIHEVVQKAIRSSNVLLRINGNCTNDNIHFMNYLKLLIGLRESFSECKEGLTNFIHTYSCDVTIVSRIENLLNHINNQLVVIDARLNIPDYKISIQKYFPQKLENYITSMTPPSYQKYNEKNNINDDEEDEEENN